MSWTSDRAVRARALAGAMLWCSWVRDFTLTVPFSPDTGELNSGGNPGMD